MEEKQVDFKTVLFDELKHKLQLYGNEVIEEDDEIIGFQIERVRALLDILEICNLKKEFLKWIESNRFDSEKYNTELDIGINHFLKEDKQSKLDNVNITEDFKTTVFNLLKNTLVKYGFGKRQYACSDFYKQCVISEMCDNMERRIFTLKSLIDKCGLKDEFVRWVVLNKYGNNNDLKVALEYFCRY